MDQALRRLIKRHQAGYKAAGKVLGVKLRPVLPERMRCYADEIVDLTCDDGSAEYLEKCALVLLTGMAATGDGGRDQCEAGDLLQIAFCRHHGGQDDKKREFQRDIQNRFRILGAQAEALIREHLDGAGKRKRPVEQTNRIEHDDVA
jgi:hypothetical protein